MFLLIFVKKNPRIYREITIYFSQELIGNSNDIKKLKLTISKIAPTGSRVLIKGDAGSGKETVARLIHQKSKRANGPFVTLTSSLLTSGRMEEILFGEEDKSGRVIRFGLFEQANNGTLFIEEVSALPLEIQRTIIRVLQDQSFFRKNFLFRNGWIHLGSSYS